MLMAQWICVRDAEQRPVMVAHWLHSSDAVERPRAEHPVVVLHLRDTDLEIRVHDLSQLMSPLHRWVAGTYEQPSSGAVTERFDKTTLTFPSGEELPMNWRSVVYRLQPLQEQVALTSNPGVPPRRHLVAR